MARPKIAAGEVGQVQVTQLANGKWRARARMRDDSGELVQLRAEAATEDAAREELLSRAKTLTTHTKAIVTAVSTIAEAAEAWLPTVKVRAENGTLSWSTYENYETTVRLTLVPVCGGVTLEALTVGRCDRVIQNLLADRGVSAARKARSVLSLSSAGSPCATTRSRRTRCATSPDCRRRRRRPRCSLRSRSRPYVTS